MTDLISRLYRYGKELEVCNEAADEIERLRADAERYRWLRDSPHGKDVTALFSREWDEAIDAAIDAAMKAPI